MTISPTTRRLWEHWVSVAPLRCHLDFSLEAGSLDRHLAICRDVGRDTAARASVGLTTPPTAILEIGSSVGFNCLALAERFPHAHVYGIEPDADACALGAAMAADSSIANVKFLQGVGEHLPFPDCSFDLILAHTVIEHVQDVGKVVSEMARVLSVKGLIHLEAPNYNWPYEPHIRAWCLPRLGKRLVRLCGYLQLKGERLGYLDHLQFVHPKWLEMLFRQNGLLWENRVDSKLTAVIKGDLSAVAAHRRWAKFLSLLGKLGMGAVAVAIARRARIYPSVLYTLRRATAHELTDGKTRESPE